MKYAAKINAGGLVLDVVTIGDDVSNVSTYCADNFDWEAPNGMPEPRGDTELAYPNPDDPANPNIYTNVTWNSTDDKWQATQDLTTGDTVQWNGAEWIVV